MTDARLDQAIRAAFERQSAAYDIPDFDALLNRAVAARSPRPMPAWLSVAAAAAVLATVALMHVEQRALESDTRLLMAELTRGTYWRAPSDRALDARAGARYLGVPDFPDMTYSFDEVKTWL